MVERIVESLEISEKILLEFFVTFSRFEYALKESGFVRADKKGDAQPDWDKFISLVSREEYTALMSILNRELYITDSPPKKQIVRNGKLQWSDLPKSGIKNVGSLLNAVRRVRNNLFHGGKFSTDYNCESRNQRLVTDALTILKEVINLPSVNSIRAVFNLGQYA
ncbi:MAG: hypothetical protein ABSG75_18455 [Syntrophales bacterium]|jgi:hypothetical protein